MAFSSRVALLCIVSMSSNRFPLSAIFTLGTSKSRRKLCRDCTEADEAVQPCVSPKIAAQGAMNALARYRGEEASHRLTRNAVVFFPRHHAIFSELQHNIICWSSDLLEQIRKAQHPHNRKKKLALTWYGSDFDVFFLAVARLDASTVKIIV